MPEITQNDIDKANEILRKFGGNDVIEFSVSPHDPKCIVAFYGITDNLAIKHSEINEGSIKSHYLTLLGRIKRSVDAEILSVVSSLTSNPESRGVSMEFKESVARADEVGEEIKAVLGESFVMGTFLRACNQPRVLLSRIELFGEAIPVCLDQISEEYDYKKFIKDRVVDELKRQILKLQEAVKKLGGEL